MVVTCERFIVNQIITIYDLMNNFLISYKENQRKHTNIFPQNLFK